uniref:FAD_binding_1 domain-containing protein n=1 Tax=Caenorhabditis japonica TaxID=281687 RepID=A0A8R1EVA5_CAEJA
MLSYYSTDESEKERLAELASPQGLDDLLEYANRCRRTTAEALRDFPKTAKSLLPDQLFEIFTPIRPRAFSIASAPIQKSIELLVAKVEYSSRMADKRKGLCSTFISRLKWGDKVYVQDKMKERVADIEALIDAGASIFVAGSTGDMPKAVLNVIKQIKGEQWTLKAEASAKIQFETWS